MLTRRDRAIPVFLVLAAVASALQGLGCRKGEQPKAGGSATLPVEAARRAGVEPAVVLDLGGGVTMRLALIPAGTFTMGSPAGEAHRGPNEAQHEVTISKPFYMGETEVTQGQWEAVMATNPSLFKGRDLPVIWVSWEDCQQFIGKLNATIRGGGFRLPTEAEWEYACRAGGSGRFCFGDDERRLGEYAWYSDNSSEQAHSVGQKRANEWGLCDMHGNVWEWCADWYGTYPRGLVTDPTGPTTGALRVLRGGSWDNLSWVCRSAARGGLLPTHRVTTCGFRLARTVLPPES